MMKLSAMKAVSATCDAEWRSPLAEEMLAGWEHDPGSGRGLSFSSNFIFFFTSAGQPRFLRFVRAEERKREAILAEMDFAGHLSAKGIWVDRAIPSREGRLVETVETGLGSFHAVVLEALGGEARETEELSPSMFADWGRLTAELHNAAQGYVQPGRPAWHEQLDWAAQALPKAEAAARAAVVKLKDRLGALPANESNFGLIHYDLSPDNIRWGGERLGVIDFDDCAHYWFAADTAYALRDLYGDRASQVDLRHPSLQAFVAGYRQARELSDEALGCLGLFAFVNNLLKLAELLYIKDEGREAGEPDWVLGLRAKLAGKVDAYRAEMELFVG
jgi:Ser/Thr protein kinase RdoA (MazF antagonist)